MQTSWVQSSEACLVGCATVELAYSYYLKPVYTLFGWCWLYELSGHPRGQGHAHGRAHGRAVTLKVRVKRTYGQAHGRAVTLKVSVKRTYGQAHGRAVTIRVRVKLTVKLKLDDFSAQQPAMCR